MDMMLFVENILREVLSNENMQKSKNNYVRI